MSKLDDILAEYTRIIDSQPPEYFRGWRTGKNGRDIAIYMVGEIRAGGHIDWLGRNHFLKAACKKYGVTKNAELKALVAAAGAPASDPMGRLFGA